MTSTTSATSSPTGVLSTLGSSAPLQLTGLASGLDTNSIISQLMAVSSRPLTGLTSQQSALGALNNQLTSIQSTLQNLALDAQALGSPGLFSTAQSVSSSNASLVSGTSATGAGVGAYQVTVGQLANAAQRTFSFTSPAAATTITVDGHPTQLAAGASAADLVAAINSDSSATVYAAATDAGTIVLSDRATGDTGTNFIQVAGAGSSLTEQTSLAKQGKDAQFTVDGVSGTASSNTVTNAIPGVSLTLGGLTAANGPVTVLVGAPTASASGISAAVQTFVKDYNSAIDQISVQLNATPNSSDPTVGTLYNDQGLSSLLGSMRTAMYQAGAGLPAGMASLMDIGVSTGAASGGTAPSQAAISGHLTIDATKLTNAIQANPGGVKSVLASFAKSFSSLVNATAEPGGTLDARISGDTQQVSQLASRISAMQQTLADKQAGLTKQFAALEAALSSNQSQATWLASQIASLP